MNNFRRIVRRSLASPFVLAIFVYRKTLSPDHGPLKFLYPYGYCRHEPTCSSYALMMLEQKPLPIALGLILKRVVSCNPWTRVSEAKMRAVIARKI